MTVAPTSDVLLLVLRRRFPSGRVLRRWMGNLTAMTIGRDLGANSATSPKGVSAGRRIAVATLVGLLSMIIPVLFGRAKYAPAIAWDVAAATLLAWIWLTIWPMGSSDTAAHATREDPTQPVGDVILLAAAVFSLFAVGFFLLQAGSAKGAVQSVLAGVGVLTVALSWLIVHTVFTLRYARMYYTGHDGGIDFKQSVSPRYSDFAYLGFTLGMTFQVSDTDLQTSAMRATALRHALLSYVLGAGIIATTINLVSGLGSGK